MGFIHAHHESETILLSKHDYCHCCCPLFTYNTVYNRRVVRVSASLLRCGYCLGIWCKTFEDTTVFQGGLWWHVRGLLRNGPMLSLQIFSPNCVYGVPVVIGMFLDFRKLKYFWKNKNNVWKYCISITQHCLCDCYL